MKKHAENSVNVALNIIGETILREPHDLYKILGVYKTNTGEELQAALDRLRNIFNANTDQNQQLFCGIVLKKIDYAYEILSDEHNRLIYDTFFHRPLDLITENPPFDMIKKEVERFRQMGPENLMAYMMNIDYYELLGVNVDFTEAQIEEGYNRVMNFARALRFNGYDEANTQLLEERANSARTHYLIKKQKYAKND